MAITAAQYAVVLTADTKGAKEGMKSVGEEAKNAADKSGGFLSTLAGFTGAGLIVNGVSTAFGFLKDQLVDSVKSGADANNVIAQTVAGLKSTRDASGMTAQSIGDLATHIMNMSGIQDDAVQTSENMLLTFTNIGKGVFPQATQAVADLATKMNGGMIPSAQQMQQQSILLGKALNDPAKGISALTRVGVTFNDQQKQQIATMMKHGDVAGAQGVILKEVQKEFGGAAAAAGQANGGFSIVTAQLSNMKEALGQQLIPILTQLMSTLQPLAQMLLGQLSGAIAGITPLFKSLQAGMQSPAAQQFAQIMRVIGAELQDTGAKIQAAALPVLKQLGDFFQQHLLPAVMQFASFAASTLIPMFGQVAVFVLSTVVPALLGLAAFVTDTLLPAVMDLVSFFQVNVLPVLEALVSVFLTDVLPVLEQLATTIITKVVPPIERMVGIILPVLVPALHAIGWVISNVVGPALNLLFTIIGFLMDKFVDMAQLMIGQVGQAFSALGTFAHNVGGWFSQLGTLFSQGGHDLIQGLIDGISKMFGPALQKMADLGGQMIAKVKGVFGIKSPSTVFADIGQNLAHGLIGGLQSIDVAGQIGQHLSGIAPQLSASLGVNASVTSSQNLAGLAGAGLAQSIAASAAGGVAGAAGAAGGIPAGVSLTIPVYLAGHRVAQVLLPDLAQAIRQGIGQREH